MATLTVYPGVKPDGTRISVLAQDLVTPIPDAGAVVAFSDYYLEKLALQQLLTDDPVNSGGTPIEILVPPITVVGNPTPGQVIEFVSGNTAQWDTPASGGADLATNPPPAISTSASLGATARAAREDHTHALSLCTTSVQGAMSAADKVVINDRVMRSYDVKPGSFGIVGDGVANDRTALNTLLNTTIVGSAVVTVQPGTYRLATSLSIPSNILWRPARGAILKPDALQSVTFGQQPDAGPYQIFDCTAAANTDVIILGGRVYPEWWGTGQQAMLCAARSIRDANGGGVVELRNRAVPYELGSYLLNNGDNHSRAYWKGPGRLKHNVNTAEASAGYFFEWKTVGGLGVRDVCLHDMEIHGNGEEDWSVLVGLNGVKRGRVRYVSIADTAREGIASSTPTNDESIHLHGCYAERVGKGGDVAPYNINANQVLMSHMEANDCGLFIEHTGVDFCLQNFIFRNAINEGVQVQSSTWNNARCIVSDGIIAHTGGNACFVADTTNSIGKTIFTDLVIYDAPFCNTIGAGDSQTCISANNYMQGGHVQGTCIEVVRGTGIVQGNVIDETHNTTTGTTYTTTGTITSGQRALTVASGSGIFVGTLLSINTVTPSTTTVGTTSLHSVTVGVASATGLAIGQKVLIPGVRGVKKIRNVVGTTVTLDYGVDAAVPAGTAFQVVMTVEAVAGTSVTLAAAEPPAAAGGTGVAVGTNTLTVGLGTSLLQGMKLTIAGVTGTKTVLNTAFVLLSSQLRVFLDQISDAAVSGATVTYRTEQWAYGLEVFNDIYVHVRNNVFLGVPWTTAGIKIKGLKATIEENTFDSRGQAYGSSTIIQIDDAGGNLGGRLLGTDFNPSKPWRYSRVKGSYLHATGAPPSLTWHVGDKVYYDAPTAGGNIGLVCTTAGTAGTLNGGLTTGAITIGQRLLTLSSLNGIYPGALITIAGVTGVKRVESVAGMVATVDTNADATAPAGSAVAYAAPVWKTWGAVAA